MAEYKEVNSLLSSLRISRDQRVKERKTFNTFQYREHSVKIREEPGVSLGSHLWGGSKVLASFIASEFQPEYFHSKRILELGAGCGLVGLCLAMDKPKQVSGQLL
jgi:predicted nicotinamide N-methyase